MITLALIFVIGVCFGHYISPWVDQKWDAFVDWMFDEDMTDTRSK